MPRVPKPVIFLLILLLLVPFRWTKVTNSAVDGYNSSRWTYDNWSQSYRLTILVRRSEGTADKIIHDAAGWLTVDEATGLWRLFVAGTCIWLAVDSAKRKRAN